MIKELLEEIEKLLEHKAVIDRSDYEWLIEQAERVQELEEEWLSIMKKLDNRELTIKTYYNEINRLHEQNKRYRKAIEKIKKRIPIRYEQEIELSAALVGIADEIEGLYKDLEGEE